MDNWAIVAVFAIIAWAVVRWRHGSRRKVRNDRCCFGTEDEANDARAHIDEIAALRQRIEVLERIVTEKGYELRGEFDKL